MLTKRIIPCLDVNAGRVVKGVSFVNLRDAGDPALLASAYDDAGADELVFLDITASSDHRDTIVDVVQRVSERVFIPLTVGGGIRSVADVRKLLKAGADKVSVNTAAVERPELIAEASGHFGNQCIVCAIDARRVRPDGPRPRNLLGDPFTLSPSTSSGEALSKGGFTEAAGLEGDSKDKPPADLGLDEGSRWEVFVHGGRTPTGIDAVKWARRAVDLGAGEILLTSMDEDGRQSGYDLPLTAAVSDATTVPVIASGGAGTLEHLCEALTVGRADAVLAASIFHFGTYSIAQAKAYMAERGLPVRR